MRQSTYRTFAGIVAAGTAAAVTIVAINAVDGSDSSAAAISKPAKVSIWVEQGDTWNDAAAACAGGATAASIRNANYLAANAAIRALSWLDCPVAIVPPTTTTTVKPTTTTTTVVPTTTRAPTTTSTSTTVPLTTTTSSTTVPPTTTTSTSTTTSTTLGPIPTTSPPTTSVPGGDTMFVETFDNNTGIDRFNKGVWNRDPYLVEMSTWPGDHDMTCNGPDTSRTVHRDNADAFYVCKDHIMDSVGDTSGYSIGWFSPNAVFASVNSVSFDVNLTNLGNRKWWKVVVVSDDKYNTTLQPGGSLCCNAAPGFLFADAGASGLPDRGNGLEGPDRLVATWGEDRTDNGSTYPAWFGIGDHHAPTTGGVSTSTDPNDKATRFPVTLIDNHNGTVTFTVAGVSNTQPGTMPPCPCRVVFEDHNYTPNKSSIPRVPNPYTWHWDNIIVR